MNKIAAYARSIRADEQNVPSPCTSVCRMDAATGWCLGCFRDIAQIAAWSGMTAAERRDVWQQIALRAKESTA